MEMNAKGCTTPLGTTPNILASDPGTCSNTWVRARRCPGASKIKLRFGSWNVGTMTSKSLELEEIMQRRRIDIMCVQETKWKNTANRARFLNNKTKAFKFIYHGTVQGRNGVGIILSQEHSSNIINITKVSDRLICIKLILHEEVWNIISAYAPQIGCEQAEKDAFYNDLHSLLQTIPMEELLFLGGDLNGHVGQTNADFEDCHGGYGFGTRNTPGEEILEFCKAQNLIILNTMFIKPPQHLITYYSGDHKTQIDYHLCKNFMKRRLKDCKVIWESLVSQHRLLLTEFFVRKNVEASSAKNTVKKIKWYNLCKPRGEVFVSESQEWLKDIINASDELSSQEMWDNLHEGCVERAKRLLGVSGGQHHVHKETWWWSAGAKEATSLKRLAFQAWTKCDRSNIDEKTRLREEYKVAKKLCKKIVAQLQAAAKEDLYKELEKISDSTASRDQTVHEVRNSTQFDGTTIYKIAAQRRRNAREIDSPRFINDSQGHLLVKDEDICHRWREYCCDLFNQSDPHNIDLNVEPNLVEVPDFTVGELGAAVRKMKRGKAAGPDEIPAEFWKIVGTVGLKWLTVLANKILHGDPMPSQWRTSFLIPLFKGRGDTRDCNNYRSIKLLSHTMKIIEKVLDSRIRQHIQLEDNQCGFVEGKSTFDAIQALRIIMEKHRESGVNLDLVFLDVKKAFDRIPRLLIFVALRKQQVPESYVRMTEDMYKDSRTRVRCLAGTTDDFDVTVGSHQGSTMSPSMFNISFNHLLKPYFSIPDVTALLFADDVVLISSNPTAMQSALNQWNSALEDGGLRLHEVKSEHLHCPFANPSQPLPPDIMLNGTVLNKCNEFTYLGSVVNQDATCKDDVGHRVSVGWMKWKENSGIFCDPKMPPKLKGRLFTTVVRPALLYGSNCWTMYKSFENKMTATEMKMLRMSMGVTKLDRIKSTRIRGSMHIKESIVEKLGQHQIGWYCHVKRRPSENPVQKALSLNVPITTRKKGRKMHTWVKQMEKKLQLMGLNEDTIQDRAACRRVTRSMVDPTGGAAANP
jgi:exonuclease III